MRRKGSGDGWHTRDRSWLDAPTRHAGRAALLVLALAAPVSADSRHDVRAWLLDGTVGPRRGEASGVNARLSLSWVPFRDLASSRDDRRWYLSVGALGAVGDLRYRTASGVNEDGTFTLAPEVRTGIAVLDPVFDGKFAAYLYLSASAGWLRAATAGADVHHHVTTRLAAGLSLPLKRHVALDMMGSHPRSESSDASDDHRYEGLLVLGDLGNMAAGLFWLILPDTIEITWERADGREYTGVAWGYSL